MFSALSKSPSLVAAVLRHRRAPRQRRTHLKHCPIFLGDLLQPQDRVNPNLRDNPLCQVRQFRNRKNICGTLVIEPKSKTFLTFNINSSAVPGVQFGLAHMAP